MIHLVYSEFAEPPWSSYAPVVTVHITQKSLLDVGLKSRHLGFPEMAAPFENTQ
jgi:hypothetical protein